MSAPLLNRTCTSDATWRSEERSVLNHYHHVSRETPATLSFFESARTTDPAYAIDSYHSPEDLFEQFRGKPFVTTDKVMAPCFVRGACEGARSKANTTGPALICLDLDSTSYTILKVSGLLFMLEVDHVGYTTWSHGLKPGNCFRIITDILVPYSHLECATRELVAALGLTIKEKGTPDGDVDPASWNTLVFFMPSVHPDREDMHLGARSDIDGSTWLPTSTPESIAPTSTQEGDGDVSAVRGDFHPDDVRDLVTWCAQNGLMDIEEDWKLVAMAVAHWNHEDAWTILDEASAEAGGYDPVENFEHFERFVKNAATRKGASITLRSIMKLAREAGYTGHFRGPTAQEDFAGIIDISVVETGKKSLVGARANLTRHPETQAVRKTIRNAVIMIQELDLGISYDELGDRTVALGAGVVAMEELFPKMGRQFEDATGNAIIWEVQRRHGIDLSADMTHRAVSTIARSNRFNPIVDWLRSLKWDGNTRLDGWLSTYCGVKDTAFARASGQIFFLGAVARALRPGIKFDTLLVLEGPQGTLKSSLVRVLGGEYTLEGLPAKDLRDRDVIAQLLGKWIVELDELEVARKADAQSLKSFLSRTEDKTRLAYERSPRTFPRRCVFIGTTNDGAYLKDDTGNRRFLPVRVGRIDLPAVERDRDQLFAEAVALWDADPSPEMLVLPSDLWQTAERIQDKRRVVSPWEDPITKYLEDEEVTVITGSGLLSLAIHKEIDRQSRHDCQEVRKIMERLGWRYGTHRDPDTGKSVKGYRRPSDEAAV